VGDGDAAPAVDDPTVAVTMAVAIAIPTRMLDLLLVIPSSQTCMRIDREPGATHGTTDVTRRGDRDC
jgi:hypothetical protein